MMSHKRTAESRRRDAGAASSAAERRRREGDAPLLCDEAPGLTSLSIEIKVSGQGPGMPDTRYIRRFALATAPALVLFACGEPRCEAGGHDISAEVMAALRAKQPELQGETVCQGTVGTEGCTRTVHYEVVATFDDAGRVGALETEMAAVPGAA